MDWDGMGWDGDDGDDGMGGNELGRKNLKELIGGV